MGHTGDANELLEVTGDELRSVVGDDPGTIGSFRTSSKKEKAIEKK